MRIALDFDNALLTRAKLRAKRERISLSRLVEQALRLRLASPPLRRGNSIRAKLAELRLNEQDVADAVQWVRQVPAGKISRKK